jgi:hypothetical protein
MMKWGSRESEVVNYDEEVFKGVRGYGLWVAGDHRG